MPLSYATRQNASCRVGFAASLKINPSNAATCTCNLALGKQVGDGGFSTHFHQTTTIIMLLTLVHVVEPCATLVWHSDVLCIHRQKCVPPAPANAHCFGQSVANLEKPIFFHLETSCSIPVLNY